MNVVGTVDGTVAHVDAVIDSILVAVERTANTIDDDDTVDVGGVALGSVLGFIPAFFVTVASFCLVGSSGVLVGEGTAVAHVDRVGNKVIVAVGAAEDGKILHSIRNAAVVPWFRRISLLKLPSVLEQGSAGVDGAVVKVVRHTIEIEVGAAVSRCEVSSRWILNANG